MVNVKAVREAEADPKQGKPRPKSGVGFPYFDLATSVELAKAMHERGGGVCDRAQLATLLGYSGVNNGSFMSRVSAAKMFGLVEDTEDGKLRVTSRAREIVAPISEANAMKARIAAFMDVELFKRVYDEFHGTTLPELIGLKNLFQTKYSVVKERISPTVRVMLDSADYAGLFSASGNRSRMVMPLSGQSVTAPPVTPPSPAPPHAPRTGGGGGGGGDDGSGGGEELGQIDPAIVGLLRRLPAGGTAISAKRRKALIEAFTAVVGFVYQDADGDEN